MQLDHLSYATAPAGLAGTLQRLGAKLGVPFSDGGVHPRFGTRNFVLPLAGGTYLEVVTALDHPAADRAPFGRAVQQRAEHGGGWLGWVVAVDDIAVVEHRLGRPAADGHRVRPDGLDLRWQQIGVNDLIADPQLPFFVHWLGPATAHPSTGGRADVRIERLEICGSRESLERWLAGPPEAALGDVAVDWVTAGDPGLVAVRFATPRGPVRVD